MITICNNCGKGYDDATAVTFCPHTRFITPRDAARKDLAFKLVTKRDAKFKLAGTWGTVRIMAIDSLGMVSLWHQDRGVLLDGSYDPAELEELVLDKVVDEDTRKEIPPMDALFEVHILNDKGKEKALIIAEAFNDLLNVLRTWCPESRELSIAKTKLEEASFFAKKAMASQPENQQ